MYVGYVCDTLSVVQPPFHFPTVVWRCSPRKHLEYRHKP